MDVELDMVKPVGLPFFENAMLTDRAAAHMQGIGVMPCRRLQGAALHVCARGEARIV